MMEITMLLRPSTMYGENTSMIATEMEAMAEARAELMRVIGEFQGAVVKGEVTYVHITALMQQVETVFNRSRNQNEGTRMAQLHRFAGYVQRGRLLVTFGECAGQQDYPTTPAACTGRGIGDPLSLLFLFLFCFELFHAWNRLESRSAVRQITWVS
jgi:hypothetical protein